MIYSHKEIVSYFKTFPNQEVKIFVVLSKLQTESDNLQFMTNWYYKCQLC